MNIRYAYNRAKVMISEDKSYEEIRKWTGLTEVEVERIRRIEENI